MTSLGEVARFIRGVTFKPSDVVDDQSGVICLRTKNVQSELDLRDVIRIPTGLVKREEQFAQHGDLVISSANSWNMVGKASWVHRPAEPMAIGGFISVLRVVSERLDARYLYRWFTSDLVQRRVRSFGQQTTNISNLNFERCLALDIPLPSIPDQRRIAEVLDRADELRVKRRHALLLLDELADATFVGKFAEQAIEEVELGTVLNFSSGKFLPAKRMNGGVIPVYGGNGVNGHHDEFLYDQPQIVIGRVGAYCGVVHKTAAKSWVTDNAMVVKWDSADFQFDYLAAALDRAALNQFASQSGQPLISAGRLASVRIPKPPMGMQMAFADALLRIRRLTVLHGESLAGLDELFESLQDQAF